MTRTVLFLILLCAVLASCTKEKTDYESELGAAAPEHLEFQEAYAFNTDAYTIRIEALNGAFYTGYNEVRLKITDTQTGEAALATEVTFRPILVGDNDQEMLCPHLHTPTYQEGDNYFSAYAVFTDESGTVGTWKLQIGFTIAGQTYTTQQNIAVGEQPNKNLNMVAFTGNDNEQYLIALVSPLKPRIGENELVAGIYRQDAKAQQHAYTEVSGYSLLLDPRMPEPSMGNHSSPNNVDLTQHDDKLYRGVVNYTMTGNWTLNFIMLNQDGRILKGTKVPTDFTPGVEGVKSELHIDILF